MAPTYYLISYQRLLKWVWIQLFYIIEPTAAHNQPLMNGVWDPFRSWSLLTSISFSPYSYQSEYLNQFSNIMRRQTQGTYVQSLASSLQVDDVPLLNCFQPHCTASSEHRSVQNFSLNFTFQDIQELLDLLSLKETSRTFLTSCTYRISKTSKTLQTLLTSQSYHTSRTSLNFGTFQTSRNWTFIKLSMLLQIITVQFQ